MNIVYMGHFAWVDLCYVVCCVSSNELSQTWSGGCLLREHFQKGVNVDPCFNLGFILCLGQKACLGCGGQLRKNNSGSRRWF